MRLVSSCEPSEEGTPWTHTSTLGLTAHPDSVFSWSLNHEHVSECSANSNCLNSAFKDWFQSSVQSDGRSVTVRMTIFNTTRWPAGKNSEGVWSLGISQVDVYTADVIFTCHLKVYYKPRDVTCTVETKKNELQIECTTTKVYPSAKCFFSMIIDGNPVHQLQSAKYTYRHTQLPGSPVYFSTQCFITVPVEAEGHFEFRVTVYPNVTDTDKDVTYGKNTSLIFNIEFPRVYFKDCPTGFIKEGAVINCSCQPSSTSSIFAEIYFYQGNESPINYLKNAPVILTTASRTSQSYKCYSINAFGWRSPTITFHPNITYGPDKVMINMDGRDTDLCYKNNVSIVTTCSVLKTEVRPSVRFSFQVNSIFVTEELRELSNESHYISQHEFLFFKGGVYTINCVAINSQFPEMFNSTVFTLEIKEPPSVPIIELNRINWHSIYSTEESTSFELDEGMFSINCHVKGGHPAVQDVRLSCSQGLITLSGGQDTYLNVSRSKNNITCTCRASHITQCYSNATEIHIHVHYYPRIKSFLVNRKSSAAATLSNSSILNLTCEAEGNPPPALMLYVDQPRIVPLQQSNNATLMWEKAVDCWDTGVYFCLASRNSVEFKRSINISVLCPLMLKYPGTNASTYYGRTHENFSIHIELFGYPCPKRYWLIKNLTDKIEINQEDDTNSSYKIEYKQAVPPYGEVVLTIINLQKSDLTNMSVYIDNSVGVLVYSFSIIEDTEQETNGVIIIVSSISALGFILATVAMWIFKCLKKTKNVTSGQPCIESSHFDISKEEVNNPYIDVIDPYELVNNDYDVIETQSQKF